jgi:hypothetical protein
VAPVSGAVREMLMMSGLFGALSGTLTCAAKAPAAAGAKLTVSEHEEPGWRVCPEQPSEDSEKDAACEPDRVTLPSRRGR